MDLPDTKDKLIEEYLNDKAQAIKLLQKLEHSKIMGLARLKSRISNQLLRGGWQTKKLFIKWLFYILTKKERFFVAHDYESNNPLSPVFNILLRDLPENKVDINNGFNHFHSTKARQYESFLQKKTGKKQRAMEKELRSLLQKEYMYIVIYPHAVHWEPLQRPQQILRALGKLGCLCLFCELSKPDKTFEKKDENVYAVYGEEYLLPLLKDKKPVVYCTWMGQAAWFEHLNEYILWYDIIDKINIFTFYDKDYIEMHNSVIEKANIVTYSGLMIKEIYSLNRRDSFYLPNAVNIEDLPITKTIDPKMQKLKSSGKPIIGFYGSLAEWLNYSLVTDTAKAHPEWEFVFIGPKWLDVDAYFKGIPNIHYFGALPYKELFSYSAAFDVSIIPFIINELTDCVSPIKFFEYCAQGLPVVSTRFFEMTQYNEAFLQFASTYSEFAQAISQCLQNDVKESAKIDGTRFATLHTWQERAKSILNIIK